MRILHINCNYIGTTLHQLMIEHLDALEIENEVFVPTYDKNIAVIKPNDNVYISECFNKWDRLVFDYKQQKIIKAIEQHYDVASFDLIHAYTLYTDGNAARVLSEKYGIPYVVAVRNTDVNDFLKKMIHLRSRGVKNLDEASKVFFLSKPYCMQVLDHYVPEEKRDSIISKVEIIPNGIDDFWFEHLYLDKDKVQKNKIKLVYAGGINKNKNVSTTLKAMDLLHSKGIETKLTVVGKVIDRGEYEKIIADVNTTYISAQPKEKLIDIYRDNDIFVMPSIHETFGLVYAEAMSQGLPVIYSKGQGFDGQFPEKMVGLHVNAESAEEVSSAIREIYDDYENYVSACVRRCTKFRWKDIVTKYMNVYNEIIPQ